MYYATALYCMFYVGGYAAALLLLSWELCQWIERSGSGVEFWTLD